MDIESAEYELAEDWFNRTTKADLIDYADQKGIDIGQDGDQLHECWPTKIIKAKYKELIGLEGVCEHDSLISTVSGYYCEECGQEFDNQFQEV